MKALIADTGPLYAAWDRHDQYHQQATQEARCIDTEKLKVFTPYPVLIETHRLILYRGGIHVAQQFLAFAVQQMNPINPTDEEYQQAIQILADYPDQQITMCDAVTAVLSRNLGIPVWTYDFHFDVMAASRWYPAE